MANCEENNITIGILIACEESIHISAVILGSEERVNKAGRRTLREAMVAHHSAAETAQIQ
jgi:hypothetical protein